MLEATLKKSNGALVRGEGTSKGVFSYLSSLVRH